MRMSYSLPLQICLNRLDEKGNHVTVAAGGRTVVEFRSWLFLQPLPAALPYVCNKKHYGVAQKSMTQGRPAGLRSKYLYEYRVCGIANICIMLGVVLRRSLRKKFSSPVRRHQKHAYLNKANILMASKSHYVRNINTNPHLRIS